MTEQSASPFPVGQKLQLKYNPAEYVEFTGKYNVRGKTTFIHVKTPDGRMSFVPCSAVIPVEEDSQNPLAQIKRGCIGKIDDLKRLVTFEKLQGTLNDIIYSMEAAQVEFYPYQFKPVLNFIRSPTQRLILADEVGLGKTIEAGLIWLEMQARYLARRLLVICPPTLMDKWEMELNEKFNIDARQVDFHDFKKIYEKFENSRYAESFAIISSYQALRPAKDECDNIRRVALANGVSLSAKSELLRKLLHWDELERFPFDLVIFDEAHYMRNPATASYTLGKALSGAAQGLLCVSATPINNKNEDLQALLSFIDPDFFSKGRNFENLVETNKPTVRAAMYLSANPIDFKKIKECIYEMELNNYISNSPLFIKFKEYIDKLEKDKERSFDNIYRAIEVAEKLNTFGDYITRTLRRQVHENRPIREPVKCIIRYSQIERDFYNTIEDQIRQHCRKTKSRFHVLAFISRQVMASSCLYAYAKNLYEKEEENKFQFEIFGMQDDEEDIIPQNIQLDLPIPDPESLAKCDSKFSRLCEIITRFKPEDRIVIFASFHATLQYLRLRLIGDMKLDVGIIHGKMSLEERWVEIERFNNGEVRILLSSEVGSEGIDLQSANILINYDMPWNPMRVEQRIGRIDRVGQKKPILHIFNFYIEDTIEQRIYERLHVKLNLFSNIFGEMEAIIGKEIRQLAVDLFSSTLTPEQENQKIEQTARALYTNMQQLNALEEQSTELEGLSDYIQKKINEYHGEGHYIQPDELKIYFKDFFGRYFKKVFIQDDTPYPGCLQFALTEDARDAFKQFLTKEHIQETSILNSSRTWITFDRNVMKELPSRHKNKVIFVNHLSPLIRWITRYYRDHGHNMCRTSAIQISNSSLPEGVYVFSVRLWGFEGITSYKKMSYGICNIESGKIFPLYESQKIFRELVRNGKDWIFYKFDIDTIIQSLNKIEENMSENYMIEYENFDVENRTMCKIREERIRYISNSNIERINNAINTLRLSNEDDKLRMIKLQEGRLKKAKENLDRQLYKLKNKSEIVTQNQQISMGIFINKY